MGFDFLKMWLHSIFDKTQGIIILANVAWTQTDEHAQPFTAWGIEDGTIQIRSWVSQRNYGTKIASSGGLDHL